MKVVFLAVNSSYAHSGHAAWCLRSVMPDGVEWSSAIVEGTVKEPPEAMAKRVLNEAPDWVAASLYLFNRRPVVEVLTRIRHLRPDLAILVGGPECLGDNRALVLPVGPATAAVRGEGEVIFRKVLDYREKGEEWRRLPGLCCTGPDGGYHDGGNAPCIANLDDLPSFYRRELAGFKKPFVHLETTRGCANGCLFCTSRGSPVRSRSLDRIRADLSDIREAGVREVRVLDRTFNSDGARAQALLRVFRDEFPDLRFHLEMDPSRLGPRVVSELAVAKRGQFHVEAGVQSLSPEVYSLMERHATVPRTMAGLQRLCALRTVAVHVDLIAGLPGATLPGIVSDLRAIMELEPAEIQLERLKLLPGTPFAATPGKWGLVGQSEPPYAVVATPGMAAGELHAADQLSRVVDWFYNQPALQELLVAGVRSHAGLLVSLADEIGRSGGLLCPDLETRFKMLASLVPASVRERLDYRWYRMGFSTRQGPCPSRPWRAPVPAAARLLEGDPSAPVARVVRVEFSSPHFFCYGTGADGGRSVVAVYALP